MSSRARGSAAPYRTRSATAPNSPRVRSADVSAAQCRSGGPARARRSGPGVGKQFASENSHRRRQRSVGGPGRFSEPLLYVWFTARCRSARRLPPLSGVSCLVSAPRPDHASRHSLIPFHTRSRTQPVSRRGDPPRAEDTSPLALPADSERSGCRNATLRPDQPPVGSSESSESSESTLCLSRGSSGGRRDSSEAVGIRQRPSGFVRGRWESSEAVVGIQSSAIPDSVMRNSRRRAASMAAEKASRCCAVKPPPCCLRRSVAAPRKE